MLILQPICTWEINEGQTPTKKRTWVSKPLALILTLVVEKFATCSDSIFNELECHLVKSYIKSKGTEDTSSESPENSSVLRNEFIFVLGKECDFCNHSVQSILSKLGTYSVSILFDRQNLTGIFDLMQLFVTKKR